MMVEWGALDILVCYFRPQLPLWKFKIKLLELNRGREKTLPHLALIAGNFNVHAEGDLPAQTERAMR